MLRESIEREIRQGIEQGLKQGLEQGIEQGIERGIEQGIERGLKEKQREIATLLCQQRLQRPLTESEQRTLEHKSLLLKTEELLLALDQRPEALVSWLNAQDER